MKIELYDITADNSALTPEMDIKLSFKPLIRYLNERKEKEISTVKKSILQNVLTKIESNKLLNDIIDFKDIVNFKEELEWIYNTLCPPLESNGETLWALGPPITPSVFYGTDNFYDLIQDKTTSFDNCINILSGKQEIRNGKIFMAYSLIFERLYHFSISSKSDYSQTIHINANGLPRYYRFNVDTRFVEVYIKDKLPDINLSYWANEIQKEDFDWKEIIKTLPLNIFTFKGLNITTVTDITVEQSVENIKNIALGNSYNNLNDNDEFIRSLRSLMGSSDIEFGLLPNLKVNGTLVFDNENEQLKPGNEGVDQIRANFNEIVKEMFNNPEAVIIEGDVFPDKYLLIKEYLKKANIKSYALLPVFHSNKIVGLLELYSMQNQRMFRDRLGNLRSALPVIAQLLKNNIDDFNHKIDNVIKNNFTALQPAVRWKFKEVSWNYIKSNQNPLHAKTIEDIRFDNVYPMYGVIDIKNSTNFRNKALISDLVFILEYLRKILNSTKTKSENYLIDKILYRIQKWQLVITENFSDNQVALLYDFLKTEVPLLLNNILREEAGLEKEITKLVKMIDEPESEAFRNRRIFENSLTSINITINQHVENFNKELQTIYPSYFEKFRTDGVEYDLYIGQSIAPRKKFSQIHLRDIRLKQLHSMAAIARATEALPQDNKYLMETTQLIFSRSIPIDISFRVDERKFDAEGSFNVRYHIVKKRIDKINIKGTKQRLTQPRRIAIVYFYKSEEEEYREYIGYLQQQGELESDLELFELEDQQGVSGLRALRVGVKY